jgi:hypothetical protein
MAAARFVTCPSRTRAHIDGMDAVAIILAIAMFAILLFMIEGIDRV